MVSPERLKSMLCVIYTVGSEPKMGSNVVRGEVEATVGKSYYYCNRRFI